ncbi:MAG: hypothetical protein ACTHJ2_04225 [Candidatus Nitrosocosmicus sp.]
MITLGGLLTINCLFTVCFFSQENNSAFSHYLQIWELVILEKIEKIEKLRNVFQIHRTFGAAL